MKKYLKILPPFMFLTVAACFLTFQITYTETDKMWSGRVSEMIKTSSSYITEPLSEIVTLVNESYYGKIEETELLHGSVDGFMSALDDNYSMHMTEGKYYDYLACANAATATGIGISAIYDSRYEGIYVVNVYPASPAQKNGIVPGDIITHVDGKSVSGMGFYGAVAALGKNEVEEPVEVTYTDLFGNKKTVSMVREIVTPERISGQPIGNNIGLIRMTELSTGDEELFKKVLENLITDDCEKFVIDIRNSSGGNVETISRILDFLLHEGTLYTLSDRSGVTTTVSSDTNGVAYPIAVVVNERTVGTAELFAAVMRDFDAATIVGETTYGKASSQEVFTLKDGCAVSFTTKMYLPPSGQSFDENGIQPDIVSKMTKENNAVLTTLSRADDNVLADAIEHIKNKRGLEIKD